MLLAPASSPIPFLRPLGGSFPADTLPGAGLRALSRATDELVALAGDVVLCSS